MIGQLKYMGIRSTFAAKEFSQHGMIRRMPVARDSLYSRFVAKEMKKSWPSHAGGNFAK